MLINIINSVQLTCIIDILDIVPFSNILCIIQKSAKQSGEIIRIDRYIPDYVKIIYEYNF